MDELEQTIMKMISFGGEGKSCTFQAIKLAEEGKIEESEKLLLKAREAIDKGRLAHSDILFYEANHLEDFRVTTLLLHAADYVSNSEDVYELAIHIIHLLKREGRE